MAPVRHKVSIVIVTHNSMPALRGCLSSLKEAIGAVDHELIVVDNDSEDGSPAEVARIYDRARVIINRKNIGFAAACNVGAKDADGEYLLFLNPDMQVDSAASINSLVEAIRSSFKVGTAGGRMRFPDGSFQPTCRKLPTIYNLLFSRGSAVSGLFAGSTLYTLPDFEETTAVPAQAATMMMIRRNLFSRVGGFDERFFMYMEDTDLCARLGMSGHTNLFVPAASGVHDWGHGSKAGRLKRAWYHHLSVWKYFMKHLPTGFSVFVLPVILALNLLVVALIPGSRIRRARAKPARNEPNDQSGCAR